MKNDKLKGVVLITLGAGCYGMLGTYVKLAYRAGFNTAEVTIAQFSLGVAGLFILTLLRRPPATHTASGSLKSRLRLTLAGASLGLTSIFYYLSVKYIAVSVAIVLLTQSVWMGVVMEAIIQKKLPGMVKMLSVLIVMMGTLLATNVLNQSISFNWKGIVFGILGALCYTATMYSTNNLEVRLPPLKRSLFMVLGGLVVILLVFHNAINPEFTGSIFYSWGLVVALFGTILPPLLFTRGMPLTGIGLGAILASIEIPIAVIMAGVLLGEQVFVSQWMGVALILAAVIWMNIPKKIK
ncbi:permease [Niastella yeongjuensis]|uniref:Permease n=1 Tax=Niastella yeongjuensis TaxID=354355 RepID=A0A1V9EPI7_9BACT|nr:DMT family transporter [Niastella yeongjuensis]OQP48026.1 permease [Niastella yeongjuensis]SEO24050.1 Threonine/homoserine efflux transporter RhtA [Niastella yeongjuensis]